MDCDAFSELGPPPNWILSIPAPPIPPFMENYVSKFSSEGFEFNPDKDINLIDESKCNFCHWNTGNKIGFVESAQQGPIIDDTLFLVIIATGVGVTLLAILLTIGFLKYREGKLKPLSDVVLAKKEKALGLERCEAVLYPTTSQLSPPDGRTSRGLWAGLKPLEGNHYTVDHCQPMDQKTCYLDTQSICPSENLYDYADYSNITYTTVDSLFRPPVLLETQHPGTLGSHLGTLGTLGTPLQVPVEHLPAPTFENVGFVLSGDESASKGVTKRVDPSIVSRAALFFGTKTLRGPKGVSHIYEMVTPRLTSSATTRRHRSFDQQCNNRSAPIISAPTQLSSAHFPALNSRVDGQYTLTALSDGSHTLTALSDGSHTLTRNGNVSGNGNVIGNGHRLDKKFTHVSLGRTGFANTTLAPSDNHGDSIYSSPIITSPVI